MTQKYGYLLSFGALMATAFFLPQETRAESTLPSGAGGAPKGLVNYSDVKYDPPSGEAAALKAVKGEAEENIKQARSTNLKGAKDTSKADLSQDSQDSGTSAPTLGADTGADLFTTKTGGTKGIHVTQKEVDVKKAGKLVPELMTFVSAPGPWSSWQPRASVGGVGSSLGDASPGKSMPLSIGSSSGVHSVGSSGPAHAQKMK